MFIILDGYNLPNYHNKAAQDNDDTNGEAANPPLDNVGSQTPPARVSSTRTPNPSKKCPQSWFNWKMSIIVVVAAVMIFYPPWLFEWIGGSSSSLSTSEMKSSSDIAASPQVSHLPHTSLSPLPPTSSSPLPSASPSPPSLSPSSPPPSSSSGKELLILALLLQDKPVSIIVVVIVGFAADAAFSTAV